MRLVDADALLANRQILRGRDVIGIRDYVTVAEIENAPTIEPERKTGKWIKKMHITETEKYISYDPDWYCACCGTKYDPYIAKMVNFCYVCGADMREEGES